MNQDNTQVQGPERSLDELAIQKLGDDTLTEIKKNPNHICTQMQKYEVICYNSGFHTGFKAGFLAASPKGKEEDSELLNTKMQLVIGRLEVNCFDEDSEMSVRVGNSKYQSLSMDEARELSHFIHSHIIHETEANSSDESAPLLSTQQGEDEEDLFLQLVADIRLYENNSQEYEDFILQLKSKYKLYKK